MTRQFFVELPDTSLVEAPTADLDCYTVCLRADERLTQHSARLQKVPKRVCFIGKKNITP